MKSGEQGAVAFTDLLQSVLLEHLFFAPSAKVRSYCEEGPGQSALLSYDHFSWQALYESTKKVGNARF